MSIEDFTNKKISTDIKSSNTNVTQKIDFKINNPTPVGWLVVSRDKQTNAGVKLALYNKLPNKFQQFFIRWFFGWWIEEIKQTTE
jgi:hypothetical protein